MYDATKVKTYQPILPAGVGPICETAVDALNEIFADLNDTVPSDVQLNASECENTGKMLASHVDNWIDGQYTIFEDYQLVIKHYQRGQLDEMHEFNGY